MLKNDLYQGFCIGKGGNPKKNSTFILANLLTLFKSLDPVNKSLLNIMFVIEHYK